MNDILIELHVPDFKKIKDFYGRLGFEIIREDIPKNGNGYLILRMGDNILCFWPGSDFVYKQNYFKKFPKQTKRGYGVEIVIMVEDIDTYYKKVKEFTNVVEDLKMQDWGLKDFRVEDPFGYYLRFTQRYNILEI